MPMSPGTTLANLSPQAPWDRMPAVVLALPTMVIKKPLVMLIAKGFQMAERAVLAAVAIILSAGVFHAALAQDAAETAVILSGVGHTQAGAGSLGAAISNSFHNAGNAIGASNARTVSRRSASPTIRPRAAHALSVIMDSGDPFEGMNAPIYKLGNGASISASGGLTPGPNVSCVKDCPR